MAFSLKDLEAAQSALDTAIQSAKDATDQVKTAQSAFDTATQLTTTVNDAEAKLSEARKAILDPDIQSDPDALTNAKEAETIAQDAFDTATNAVKGATAGANETRSALATAIQSATAAIIRVTEAQARLDEIKQALQAEENPVSDTEVVDLRTTVATQSPSLRKTGFKLSVFILWIISGYVFFLILYLLFNSYDATDKMDIPTNNISDSSFAHQMSMIQALQQETKNSRDFVMQISQMVLLNLLLPTLTAILGYIFGSREGSRKPEGES